jgi:disulfide bond formation protein DsbB
VNRSIVFTPREPVMPGGLVLNGLCLLAVSNCLLALLYTEWYLRVPPCELCMLQRTGIILTGMGFMKNLCQGVKSAHYGVALLGALLTGLIALRQLWMQPLAAMLSQPLCLFAALFALTAIIVIACLLGVKSAEYPGTLLLLQTAEATDEKHGMPWGRILVCAVFIATVAVTLSGSMINCTSATCGASVLERLGTP